MTPEILEDMNSGELVVPVFILWKLVFREEGSGNLILITQKWLMGPSLFFCLVMFAF